MFLSKNKKNNVYPCKSQFFYTKVRFKGVNIIQACFPDAIGKKNILSGYPTYLESYALPLEQDSLPDMILDGASLSMSNCV